MRWACLVMAAGMYVSGSMAAQAAGGLEEKLMHVETTFEVVVHAPYEETAALFGPEGERAWAGKHWDPQFVYPAPGNDTQGAVFTISHSAMNAVWVIAQHDLEARHFQYVYFIADLMVTTIDVRFRVVDTGTTAVTVTYARTAVSREGDAHVKAMSEGDQAAGKHWQKAIDEYLASRKAVVR
jgi:hypothetical protein